MTRRNRSRRIPRNNKNQKAGSNQTNKSSTNSSASSSDTDRQEVSNEKLSGTKSAAAANTASTTRATNVSDRERRMRKRQALDSDALASDVSANDGNTKRLASLSKKPKIAGDGETIVEEVIKMKLNTGMLYIYRGSRPRVEFIRRY
mmetsp:Transcript_15571/g.22197  ORF Transcript_15571/g.22197 Transcript_15571/m.22197 type:complete len:147 (-) Transcript_15571:164-604(-)